LLEAAGDTFQVPSVKQPIVVADPESVEAPVVPEGVADPIREPIVEVIPMVTASPDISTAHMPPVTEPVKQAPMIAKDGDLSFLANGSTEAVEAPVMEEVEPSVGYETKDTSTAVKPLPVQPMPLEMPALGEVEAPTASDDPLVAIREEIKALCTGISTTLSNLLQSKITAIVEKAYQAGSPAEDKARVVLISGLKDLVASLEGDGK